MHLNAPKRLYEKLRHLQAGKITGGEDDRDHAGLLERAHFVGTVSNTGILGENDPLSPSDLSEPFFVGRAGRKMVIMNLDEGPRFAQSVGNFPTTK